MLIIIALPAFGVGWAEGAPPPGGSGSLPTSAGAPTCLGGWVPPIIGPGLTVALVKPVLTAAPYSQYKFGSFYAFYSQYGGAQGNITTSLGLLSTPLSDALKFNGGWGASFSLYKFMDSTAARDCGLVIGRNVVVLSDVNVSSGELFTPGGGAKFDVVVIGFAEYVTQDEYSQLQRFVASGGRLVIMGGDDFVVRVDYSPVTGNETYVVGHGFDFNGATAWRSPAEPFRANNTDWVGSNYCCFHEFTYSGASLNQSDSIGAALQRAFGPTVFREYISHEEASVTNSTMTSLIGTFVDSNGTVVAAYSHSYRRGTVVCMCVFADDIISTSASAQYFLVLAISPAGAREGVAVDLPWIIIVFVGEAASAGVAVWALWWRRAPPDGADARGVPS